MTTNLIFYLLSFNFLFTSSCESKKNLQEQVVIENTTLPKDSISKDELLGKIDQSKHPDFVVIDRKYTNKDNIYLRKEAYDAFLQMYEAAKKDGITLTIISATRNFNYQKKIWEDKWSGNVLVQGNDLSKTILNDSARAKTILLYSAMPGTSRHHWGTDIDLNDLNDAYFTNGHGKKVYDWLVKNAGRFGYCQTYTKKGSERPEGYEEEKWHWSYTPISSRMLKAYVEQITDADIQGFLGASSAVKIQVVKNYVQGVNPACK